ncbi:MAG: Spy/CpxP family protein refolding chaperone [Flavobacteriales bacterium]
MKTRYVITLLLIGALSVTTVSAQEHKMHKSERTEGAHKPNPEKFKAMKIAYLTDKLSLTPEEAQQFWPIYNEFESKKKAERKEFRDDKKDMGKEIELSDADIEKMLNERIQLKQDELNLEKEYLAKFKMVLPMKKVGELYKAEESFKRDLLRKMRTPPTPPTPPTPTTPVRPVSAPSGK